jgi:hypothetical protein
MSMAAIQAITAFRESFDTYVSDHALATNKPDSNYQEWYKAIVPKPCTNLADLATIADSVKSLVELDAETLAGLFLFATTTVEQLKSALTSKYNGKSTMGTVKTPAELQEQRGELVKEYEALNALANTGRFGLLTPEMLLTVPGFRKKIGIDGKVRLTIPSAPKVKSTTSDSATVVATSNLRRNNTKVKVTINGKVPDNHPAMLGDAMLLYFGKELKEMRATFFDFAKAKMSNTMHHVATTDGPVWYGLKDTAAKETATSD